MTNEARSDAQAWHAVSADRAFERLTGRPDGLSDDEAGKRLAEHGPNRLPPPKRRGALARLLAQFNNLLIYVLLGAAGTTAALGHWIDTGVILAVVLVNAVVGFVQEGKAEKALDAIRDMLAPKATAIRDGHRRSVRGEEIVPGDVIVLEPGDRVPADLRLFEVKGLKVDEAMLTGESVAVDKVTGPVDAATPLGDRLCLAFSGTMVASGSGKGLVVATGEDTEIGRISGMMAEVEAMTTPLLRQMGVFAKWLTVAIVGFAALILAFGLFVRGEEFTTMFMAAVGLTVAAIPEGLPAILTVTLAIGVQGMARCNAIVRRLPAIETLGSVTVICSDKTGTLTRNEMTVAAVATSRHLFQVGGSGYEPHGAISLDDREVEVDDHPLLAEMSRAALLCSDAHLVDKDGQWAVEGDPMEGALIVFARKAGLDPDGERKAWPRTDAIPFDSRHRFMASLNHDHEGHGLIVVKGAPERILEMCGRQRGGNGDVGLDRADWQRKADDIASEGRRLLAIAVKDTDSRHADLRFDDVEGGLVLLGLVGLMDPPREEAIAAVAECRSAGIQVKMITGDHAATAAAIARMLALENPGSVLTGSDLEALDDDELRRRAIETSVFARTSPEHKLRLVKALQAEGEVVAMTGDGVNDAPALKRADIGIAMGRKGSEAAKEASEMVLADDNFATIDAAVEAGRTVYDNLKKAIIFLLPVNGGESASLIAAIVLGMTLPISPVQILWVNMVSSVALAMSLAFEPADPDVMTRPPRPPDEPILSGFLVWRIFLVSALFLAGVFGMFAHAKAQGLDVEEARTIAVNTLVVMEIFYLFTVRHLFTPSITWRDVLGTPAVLIAVAAVTALQFLFTYAPFMHTFFASRPLSLVQGLQVVAVGIAVMLVLEAEKRLQVLVRGRLPGRRSRARRGRHA